MKQVFSKKTFIIFFIAITIFSTFKVLAFFSSSRAPIDFENKPKLIYLNDNGLVFELFAFANTVEDFFKEKNITIGEHDQIIPDKNTPLFPHVVISIKRAVKINIEADGKKFSGYALGRTVAEALRENNVELGRLDKTAPGLSALPQNNLTIIITRINVEEVTKQEEIDFKTTTKNDSKLGWREKKIETPGEKGIKEVRYKITYKNGKEISRVVLVKSVVKDPVTQVEVQGTYVKTGKASKGQGTWYAFKGGLFAASPWLPIGSYAKVTATASGKSVIVQINDRGPTGPGRIIDLDKMAFQKIAPLGAGVINVKVEEVLN